MPDSPPQFAGSIIITWPRPSPAGSLHGWAITLTNAATGAEIRTVTAFQVILHAAADDLVWADLDMLADGEGAPIYGEDENGLPPRLHIVDGEPVRGTFPFLVTEMRVAEADGA